MLKKIFVSIITALFLLVSVSIPLVKAESTWYDQTYEEWSSKVYDDTNPQEIFGERYTAAQVQWIIYSLRAIITSPFIPKDINTAIANKGEGLVDLLVTFLTKNGDFKIASTNTSSLAVVLGLPSNKAISGIEYFKNNLRKFHLIPTASAQEGFGYKNIDVVMDMWKAVRNFAYALATIAVVIMAFMIMFRVKINPQTVITVQSALPKIAITLILITFSYAIAGLMVDLMYVVIGLLATLFSTLDPVSHIATGEWYPISWYGLMTSGFLGLGILGNYFIYASLFWIGFTITLSTGTITSLLMLPGIAIIIFIITLLIAILFIWHMIKVLFLLIKTVANIYIAVIFAPLQIGMGLISPGMGFGVWIKGLLGNLAVFPVISALFGLALIFATKGFAAAIQSFNSSFIALLVNTLRGINNLSSGGNFLTNIMESSLEKIESTASGTWPFLAFASNANALIFMAISFVIITLIPKASDIIKGMIEGKGFDYGTGIGEALHPVKAGVSMGAGYAAEYQELKAKIGGDERAAKISAAARIFQQLLGR